VVPAPDAPAFLEGGPQRLVRPELEYLDPAEQREAQAAAEDAVCQVLVGGRFQGTGFLIGPDLVLTNWHVVAPLVTGALAREQVKLRFDVLRLPDGALATGPEVGLATQGEAVLDASPLTDDEARGAPDASVPGSDQLDHAVLRLAWPVGQEASRRVASQDEVPRGWLSLEAEPPPLVHRMPLSVLQHPRGDPLALSTDGEGVLELRGTTRVRYDLNTESGSSGSPVFDRRWRIVALHHYGDPLHEQAAYNQGVTIASIRARLLHQGLGALLRKPPLRISQRLADRAGQGLTRAAALPSATLRHALQPHQARLEIVRRDGRELGIYKTLHANLHRVQEKLRVVAAGVAEMRAGRMRNAILFGNAVRTMRTWLGDAERASEGLSADERAWIGEALAAVEQLTQAASARDAEAADTALEELRSLRQAAITLNVVLVELARRIPLAAVSEGLAEIARALGSTGVAATEAARELHLAKEALDRLHGRLAGLVEQHGAWQSLDTELAVAEGLPGRRPDARVPRWPRFRAHLVELCDRQRAAPWSAELLRLLLAWETAAAEGRTEEAETAFIDFADACRRRFFEVDEELHATCNSLAVVIGPLGDLLARL
jgi:hypothetical protein